MLKSWSIQNFKPILDSGELKLAPVTVLAGRNSSGKSSLIQSILMIAQTLSNPLPERALLPNERIVQLGMYGDVLCRFSNSRKLTIQFALMLHSKSVSQDMFEVLRCDVKVTFNGSSGINKIASAIGGASEVQVETFTGVFDWFFTPALDKLKHLDIREPLPDDDLAGPSQDYGFRFNKVYEEELAHYLKDVKFRTSKKIDEAFKHGKHIYIGEFFGYESAIMFLEALTGTPRFIVTPFHFLPKDVEFIEETTFLEANRQIEKDGIELMVEDDFVVRRLPVDTEWITRFFSSQIRYLGPLRADPGATEHSFAPTSQLDDVGFKGEYAAVVYHHNQLAQIDWYNPNTTHVQQGTLQEALDIWANYLDVASQVRTETAGSLGVAWSVVTKKGQQPRTLSEVGVGVSQILPILVMGLLAPQDTLLIIEQPELHLHPSVQARLGDFFMGLAKCGKQCLIETHSENLVSQLRYHIVEAGGMDKSDCLIYFVDQDERGAAKFEKVEISPNGNILNWPSGFFDETMLQEDRITAASLKKRTNGKNHG